MGRNREEEVGRGEFGESCESGGWRGRGVGFRFGVEEEGGRLRMRMRMRRGGLENTGEKSRSWKFLSILARM